MCVIVMIHPMQQCPSAVCANAVKCNEDQAMFIQFREYDLYHEIEIQVNFSDASFY